MELQRYGEHYCKGKLDLWVGLNIKQRDFAMISALSMNPNSLTGADFSPKTISIKIQNLVKRFQNRPIMAVLSSWLDIQNSAKPNRLQEGIFWFPLATFALQQILSRLS